MRFIYGLAPMHHGSPYARWPPMPTPVRRGLKQKTGTTNKREGADEVSEATEGE